jgi:hypothetical protein
MEAELWPAKRVDAAPSGMKAPRGNTMLDRIACEAKRKELLARNDAMLPLRESPKSKDAV